MTLTQREAHRLLGGDVELLALFYYLKNSYPFFYSHQQKHWVMRGDVGAVADLKAAADLELKIVGNKGNQVGLGRKANAPAPRTGTLGSLYGRLGRL